MAAAQPRQWTVMNSESRDIGDFRIHAGALGAAGDGGYVATVVVSRMRGRGDGPCEVFRDESLACGYRWRCREDALRYAFERAHDVIHRRPDLLVS